MNKKTFAKTKRNTKKILVAVLITFVVIGLIGVASASIFDEYQAGSYGPTLMDYTSPTIAVSSFDAYVPTLMDYTSPTIAVSEDYYVTEDLSGSYAHTSIDYTSPTIAVSEDYYGTHTSDVSVAGITTHTDVILYDSPSLFDSVDFGAYISSPSLVYSAGPSIFDLYASSLLWP